MTSRTLRDPSPLRSALVHSSLGFVTLVGTLGLGGATIHLIGDADAASPSLSIALFENNPDIAPGLNPRLPGDRQQTSILLTEASATETDQSDPQPDLGIEYGTASAPTTSLTMARASSQSAVRINGRLVQPGQSLSQVSGLSDQPVAATVSTATVAAQPSPQPAGPQTQFERYARAFENSEGKPTISIIVGGLGINRGRTNAAINELPPEITLSFAPTTSNLQTWINRARAAGHEVLIELPMEPYDYGRESPHPQVLQVGAGRETNARRLNRVLSRARSYTGVMNYQGGKFATSADAAGPVFDALEQKGLAFFEDGSLSRSVFSEMAASEGVPFGKAVAWIDARPEGDEISKQLMRLEAEATEKGASLGMGISYPVTIDLLKEWSTRLEAKGFVLAPASHFARQSSTSGQIKMAALDQQG